MCSVSFTATNALKVRCMANAWRSTAARLTPPRRRGGWLSRLFAHGAVSPGHAYGTPGQGRSLAISIATSLGLFLLWYAVTGLGMIPPLFLPSPADVWAKCVEVATEGFGGATLLQHTLTSM